MCELTPMTWCEFKRKAEDQGLRDSDVVSYIDWGGYASDPNPKENAAYVNVERFPNGKVAIRD